MFFTWVKRCVPQFNPKCFVSDDASYIHSAFDKCINPSAFHISCWWHKANRTTDKTPAAKRYRKSILTLAYDGDPKDIDKQLEDIADKIKRSTLGKSTKNELLLLLE